jgi:hypothetical protein
MMAVAVALTVVMLAFLIFATTRSIHNERSKTGRSVWREFGLGLILMILFFVSWIGHGIAEWQVFTDEQSAHGESTSIGDFIAVFGQSTLENWQSEFLQLFSFVTLAALYVHRGSAESKDTDEKMEASLRRIEAHLGTLPPPEPGDEEWELPDIPMQHHGHENPTTARPADARN